MATDPRNPTVDGADVGAVGLRGSRCSGCSVTAYPAEDACPRCGGPAEPAVLQGTGRLWTWTVQRYAPKSPPYQAPPGGFQPFALGYVELVEGVRVAAVLEVGDLGDLDHLDHLDHFDNIRIGMPLTVTAGHGVPRARPMTPGEEGS